MLIALYLAICLFLVCYLLQFVLLNVADHIWGKNRAMFYTYTYRKLAIYYRTEDRIQPL